MGFKLVSKKLRLNLLKNWFIVKNLISKKYLCKMHKLITSPSNPLVKQFFQLQEKSKNRRNSGLFIIEGQREIELAIKGSYSIKTVLFCPEIISAQKLLALKQISDSGVDFIDITFEIYQKLAYRSSTEGVLALANSKDLSLESLKLSSHNSLILVAEAPEKPGNIGAILRTADAANLDAVIIANPKTDIYNPNIIRSSIGCLFTNQVATGTTSEIIAFLKTNSIAIYCASLESSRPYHGCDFTGASALVVGTESQGLTREWLENSTQNIIIPMQGEIDSMNVSVAAGILIFEAKRQRNFQ